MILSGYYEYNTLTAVVEVLRNPEKTSPAMRNYFADHVQQIADKMKQELEKQP